RAGRGHRRAAAGGRGGHRPRALPADGVGAARAAWTGRGGVVSPRVRYVVVRILLTLPALLAMSIFVFLLIRLVPGDPVRNMLGFRATPQNIATVRADLHLDESLPHQYVDWLRGLVHGDLGQDYISHASVRGLLAQTLPVTIELTMLSMGLAVL